MALQKCGLNVNRFSKELQPHGTVDFPCAGYSSYYTDKEEDAIPWHWHEEIEFIYIKDGQMDVKIPSGLFHLDTGDCMAINSNVLHYGKAAKSCHLRSLVFSPKLITGDSSSAFAKNYILPLTLCRTFTGCQIKAPDCETISCWFLHAFQALEQESFGFEFIVRENLSHICLFLYQKYQEEICRKEIPESQDALRIRTMLTFIHENFSDNITLSEIASTANIGERECLRCFQRTLRLSPIQYLLEYRITQAAEMLLKNPTDSISKTAALCGFSSPSNFSKMFRRFFNRTPREYRTSR